MLRLFVLVTILKGCLLQALNRCFPFFVDDRLAYDLSLLDVKNNYVPYEVPVAPFTNNNGTLVSNAKIIFKVCGAISTPPVNCVSAPEVIAYYIEGSVCLPMTALLTELGSTINKDNDNNPTGIVLAYSNGNLPPPVKASMNYSIKYTVDCDKNIVGDFKWSASYNSDGYINAVTKGAPGCSYGIGDLLDMFSRNKYIFFPIFIILGIIFTFFGRNAYRWTLIGVGLVLGFLTVAGICYALGMFNGATDRKRYTIYGIGIVVGCILGYLMFRFEEHTTSIVVGTLALIMCKAILVLFLPQLSLNSYVTMGLMVISGGIGGVVASQWRDPSLIVSTSFGGSFMSILCLGYITTILDPPGIIVSKARSGQAPVVPYILGCVWIGVSVAGMYYQCNQMKKEEELKQHCQGTPWSSGDPSASAADKNESLAKNPF